jgi:hypothetical protein
MRKPMRQEQETIDAVSYVPLEPGTIGVAVYERLLERGRKPRVTFTTRIPFTNLNPTPLLRGWLGTTDNYYREALGVYVVVSYDPTALRLTLRPATEEEVRRWLNEVLPERWRWRMEDLVKQGAPGLRGR